MENLEALVAQVQCAYLSNNNVTPADLSKVLADVRNSFGGNGSSEEPSKEAVELKPAVSIKKSVTPEYIVCLECGDKFKSLKRHLRTHHGLSPEEYREKWGLPETYPMAAPSYAETRSELAKKMGLGKVRTA